jgi:hypothetical protein
VGVPKELIQTPSHKKDDDPFQAQYERAVHSEPNNPKETSMSECCEILIK